MTSLIAITLSIIFVGAFIGLMIEFYQYHKGNGTW